MHDARDPVPHLRAHLKDKALRSKRDHPVLERRLKIRVNHSRKCDGDALVRALYPSPQTSQLGCGPVLDIPSIGNGATYGLLHIRQIGNTSGNRRQSGSRRLTTTRKGGSPGMNGHRRGDGDQLFTGRDTAQGGPAHRVGSINLQGQVQVPNCGEEPASLHGLSLQLGDRRRNCSRLVR